jgi:hypothetical protein
MEFAYPSPAGANDLRRCPGRARWLSGSLGAIDHPRSDAGIAATTSAQSVTTHAAPAATTTSAPAPVVAAPNPTGGSSSGKQNGTPQTNSSQGYGPGQQGY